jgi:hypothetical protein
MYSRQSSNKRTQKGSFKTDSSNKRRAAILAGETGKAARDDQSEDDLLSHMSKLSQLLPTFDNFDVTESQRGSLRSFHPG